MTTSRRGGPNLEGRQAALEFISGQLWAALCVEDADGALRCTPVFLRSRDGDRARLAIPDGQPEISGPGSVRAALVADEFQSYEGIRGVIARGSLTCDRGQHDAELDLRHVTGFSFLGRVPPGLSAARSIV